jgi:hypothetical protein
MPSNSRLAVTLMVGRVVLCCAAAGSTLKQVIGIRIVVASNARDSARDREAVTGRDDMGFNLGDVQWHVTANEASPSCLRTPMKLLPAIPDRQLRV